MVQKPSKNEQEYFIAQEVARVKKLREEQNKKQADEECRKLRELHYLHCAKCGQKMTTTAMAGIEIEVCPSCGGIYLDAGELAKIIDEQTHGPFTSALAYARRLWNAS